MKRIKLNESVKMVVKSGLMGVVFLIASWFLFLIIDGGGVLTAQKERFTILSHDKTNFPLIGKHRTVPCSDCHLKGVIEGTPISCEACHWYRKPDDRYKLQLGIQCGDCHTPTDWKQIKPGAWEHGNVTGFMLEGIHKSMDCIQCHVDGLFKKQPHECYDCHRENFERTQSPDHRAAHFPTDCRVCHHSMVTWAGAQFDHSHFPLRGSHASADCTACHKNNLFTGLPSQCVDCHLDNYNNAKDPDHIKSGFPTDCTICHGIEAISWDGAGFLHSTFILKGNHKTTSCSNCHKNGVYAGTSSLCAECHINEYNNTKNPNHKLVGYSTDCERCHGSEAITWEGAVLDHSKFPLNGKHKVTACTDCHKNGVYTGTPSLCVNCHQADYDKTQNPNHKQAGYSTDCERCHGFGAESWYGAIVDHSFFPLNGKHKTSACTDCHKNGVYKGTPTECVGCHLTDYNNTTDPNHKQAGFSTVCSNCHGTEALTWQNAIFDHTPYWALQGAHKTLDCNKCHSVGYSLPRDCYGCHKADYDSSSNPNHKLSGFPTTCEVCHYPTHVTWTQAVFDHKFPIKTGKHAGFNCTDCHLNSNFLTFSCIDCHTHNKSSVDSEHHGVAGYTYNSQACYTCHPRGSAD